MENEFQHPICSKAIDVAIELFNVADELERAKQRRAILKSTIKREQERLRREYGEGYITRKRVKKSRFPIFRSVERGKDYNLERNFPDVAQTVNEYYEAMKQIKELEAKRKKLDEFLNTAYTICVPSESRDPKKAYKERKAVKDIAYVSSLEDEFEGRCEDGDEEACESLRELRECIKNGFRVEKRRIICE